tara:strand:+ start:804 stop:1094 length:291 start_codon:yes stop_codon:yes gene_type:complete
MNNFCSCLFSVASSSLHITYKTLPPSPMWIQCNYKNLDCQPDEEFSEEKRIDFHKNLLKLINYPIDKCIIKKYDNHPDGPIKTHLQWQVISKRRRL